MNGPEVLIPIAFFVTVAVIVINVLRFKERGRSATMGSPLQVNEIASRLDRMEQAIDSIAVEVERISEGQRFTTRLLSERTEAAAIPMRADRVGERIGG